jgi:hypothetical protein
VKDEIEARWKEIDVAAQSLAHAALDAVALVGLAHHFADGETDARRGGKICGFSFVRLRREEPAHRGGLVLAAGCVGAHIVGVLAQARARQALTLDKF